MLKWDYRRLTLETLLRYASNVNKKCGYSNIWGFIDGTFYRPTENQRLVSSGYKRAHGFKYQAVVTPDGLITSLFGPMEGKIGDWNMLKESGLEDILKNINSLFPDGHHLYIYGDPAYSEGYGIMGPFKLTPSHLVLTREESEFNVRMSGVRIAVEQLFGLVLNKWAYNGYKYGLRQQSTAVAAHYMVSVLLTNIQTCLEGGNEVSQSFHCIPPSLDDYLKLD
ncbi:hypothetical protein LIPSTDRAFT_30961 [Lipomyces starkeyi NRRL Y-11557]|uniref:DDE Tnp4 domain-containing protein n=1 Tax=Lipomyces starkeyi NRRL Y-11557 TaxID=675824 RepID=A0A1E3PV14_LIPST|nr:hypothetical protein LIPSTDRAFT_30961 [Lipomyces starkeyi NRRL Y-11557]